MTPAEAVTALAAQGALARAAHVALTQPPAALADAADAVVQLAVLEQSMCGAEAIVEGEAYTHMLTARCACTSLARGGACPAGRARDCRACAFGRGARPRPGPSASTAISAAAAGATSATATTTTTTTAADRRAGTRACTRTRIALRRHVAGTGAPGPFACCAAPSRRRGTGAARRAPHGSIGPDAAASASVRGVEGSGRPVDAGTARHDRRRHGPS
jgi:hypothetical protein